MNERFLILEDTAFQFPRPDISRQLHICRRSIRHVYPEPHLYGRSILLSDRSCYITGQ